MADAKYEPRLKQEYVSRIRKALQEQFNFSNEMQIPKLDKIVINMGVGEATADSKKPTVAGWSPATTGSCPPHSAAASPTTWSNCSSACNRRY